MQIKLDHLTKSFGENIAVNDLSITLESGKLIALLLCSVAAGVTLKALSAKDPPRLPVRLLICLMLMAVYGLCFPLARIF